MTREQIAELPLYPKTAPAPRRPRRASSTTSPPLQRHHLIRDGHEIVQTFEPQLTPLQAQLVDLLGVPASAYTSSP